MAKFWEETIVNPIKEAQALFSNGLQDGAKFYDYLRKSKMFGPSFDPKEFDGCEAVLGACAKAKWPLAWTAYALATAYHETAHTMQPVKEYGGTAYYTKMYDIQGSRPQLAKDNGNTSPGDGAKYCGRGYVQLTWKNNYAKAEKKLGKPLISNPDLAMDCSIASDIMISGMGEGWFTGKSCKTYLPTSGTADLKQFTDARRIINGQDKARLIAEYAVNFQQALSLGKWK
jgi:hypothetical protein